MRQAKRRSRVPDRESALSLIEVTLALGIFAFAIVAIIGLLSASLNSDRTATRDTALTRMAESAMTFLQSEGFQRVRANTAYAAQNTTPDLFFDNYGQLALDAAGKPSTAALTTSVYSCTITRKASASANLDYVSLEFRWPLAASFAKQESRFVNASLANEY